MGQTRYYGLAFFDFGDQLDSTLNVQREINRFVVIDRQLYGLYNVFGNGVISGWNVTDAGYQQDSGISISVSSGVGVIKYLAAETSIPASVTNLTPNSNLDIYASITGETYQDRVIGFFASDTSQTSDNIIRVARVATGANSISWIDNTVRDDIGFVEIIEDEINQHHHRGTPSKIDLESEVKNQLPGARLSDIDASKITTGTFDVGRLPLIDHNNLENSGLLTHAALDAFVRTFSQNNKELLGEISSVNMLKTVAFLKYIYSGVDEHFVNELTLIPGISPNSFIDFVASTAHIDLDDNCISGYPAQTGMFTSVYWNTTFAFNTYRTNQNILVQNNTLSLDRSSEAIDNIADFTDGPVGFDTETRTVDNDQAANVVRDGDGNNVARLGGGGTNVYYYRKNFSESKNWDGTYDELVIKVKTTEQVHTPVYMYVINGDNRATDSDGNFTGSYGSVEAGNIAGIKKPSASWTLLAEDEYMSSLTEKVFDISSLGLDEVSQITIYTEDDFTFEIDDIFARRTNLVSESGSVTYRYSTEASVVFHSIFYEANTPDGTSVSVRVKAAGSDNLLSRSAYTLPLDSGDVFAFGGTNAEIEVSMTTDDQTISPTVSSIELRMLVDADFTGFVIDTASEWNRGTLTNVNLQDGEEIGKSDVVISTPINVGGRHFAKASAVSEINDQNVGVLGFSGNNMPVSPNQAYSWSTSSTRGFNRIASSVRQYSKNFLIADTNNSRVLEVDSTGSLVKGFGSTYVTDTDFYPLSAVYNATSQTLGVVFTKKAVVNDITKIMLNIGSATSASTDSTKVYLTSDDTVSTTQKAGGKVLEVVLSDETAARLVNITTNNLWVDFDGGAFTDTIVLGDNLRTSGNNVYSPTKGLACFVGNFTFVDNIKHPVFVNETNAGNWIIANSSVIHGEPAGETFSTVPDIIEIDPSDPNDTDDKITSSAIKFSDYSLGSILEYEDDHFLIAGIEESSTTLAGQDGSTLLADAGDNPPESLQFRADAVDALKSYRGRVVLLDKINNRSQLFYMSPDGLYPSDIDMDSGGNYLVAESSFYDASGRLLKLDNYGNVIWNYGSGTYNIINDAKVLNDDKIIVSV